MLVKKEINGHIYEFELLDNAIIANKIKGRYLGYNLTQFTEGCVSKIYMQETGCMSSGKKKCIGTLIYNQDKEKITLYKNVNPKEHLHIKSNSYGVNSEIIKNLRTSDGIIIDDKKNKYYISVAKALKVGQYLHFNAYELQLFIPIEQFKILSK